MGTMNLKQHWGRLHRHLSSGKLVNRRLLRLLCRILLAFTIVPIVLQILLAYWVGNDARLLPSPLRNAKNLLIVTAHPDDECLFFAPAILGIIQRSPDVTGGLIVLSTGNNYGIGDARKKELQGSCEALGIGHSRCLSLDDPKLQDNPKVWWDEVAIQDLARKYIKKWNVDAILTFDEGGVSGHINHRAVSVALQKYAASDDHAPPTYVLTTTGLLRKYTFLADLPLTSLSFSWRILQAMLFPLHNGADAGYGNKALLANSWGQYVKTRQAFGNHISQYSWDRHLYLVLSRYVWFNDLRLVPRNKH